jgi:hypothetical protein
MNRPIALVELIPRLRSNPDHSQMVIGDISALLRYVGLLANDEPQPEPGESLTSIRARRLESLQPYSALWEKHRLERLTPDLMDVAEAQIIEAAYHHAMDLLCTVEVLHKEGHDAATISRITGVSLERVLRFTAPA